MATLAEIMTAYRAAFVNAPLGAARERAGVQAVVDLIRQEQTELRDSWRTTVITTMDARLADVRAQKETVYASLDTTATVLRNLLLTLDTAAPNIPLDSWGAPLRTQAALGLAAWQDARAVLDANVVTK